MNDKEYEVTIKIRNNLLLQKIVNDSETIRKFCEKYGIDRTAVDQYLGFKMSLLNKRGKLRKSVERLCEIFDCNVWDIFPDDYDVKPNTYKRFFDKEELIPLTSITSNEHLLEQFKDPLSKKETLSCISDTLSSLGPREEMAVRCFYLETLDKEEAANKMGISRQRFDQILNRAIRKLQHPSRKRKLLPAFEYFNDLIATEE